MGQATYSEFHSVGVLNRFQFISIEPVAILQVESVKLKIESYRDNRLKYK